MDLPKEYELKVIFKYMINSIAQLDFNRSHINFKFLNKKFFYFFYFFD